MKRFVGRRSPATPANSRLFLRVREELRKRRHSRSRVARSTIFALDTVRTGLRFVLDGGYRSARMELWLRPDGVHQTTTLTGRDRYPEVFAACRHYLGEHHPTRLLSFGCSTGEEVLTLREYFPRAHIVGADVNAHCLAACNRLPVDGEIRFIWSEPAALLRHGPFDAVFCMAVLQRTPHVVEDRGLRDLRDAYPFEKFDRQLRELDALVVPGGLLVVHHAHYRVTDSTIAARYERLAQGPSSWVIGKTFDTNSRRIDEPLQIPSVFVKHQA